MVFLPYFSATFSSSDDSCLATVVAVEGSRPARARVNSSAVSAHEVPPFRPDEAVLGGDSDDSDAIAPRARSETGSSLTMEPESALSGPDTSSFAPVGAVGVVEVVSNSSSLAAQLESSQ